MHSCQVHDQNFHLLQTFASNNRTQGQIEKSQQELKRTRLENRRCKNLAELAVVYHKMSKSLVTEYEDGKRKKIKKKEMVGFIFLLQSFLWMIQMHFICLHCQDAKPNGSDDTAEEVWLKKMKLSPNRQLTKFGKYMQPATLPLTFDKHKR